MKPILYCGWLVAVLCAHWPATGAETNTAPLPEVKELLQRAIERGRREKANDRIFATNYVFIRARTNEFRNAKGEIKKQETKVRTNDPAVIIAAAAKPRAPRPKPAKRGPEQRASDTSSNVQGKAFEEDEFLLNGDLLDRFDFKITGRELVRGRPTLLLEFAPKKGKLPERNLKDKFINKGAGRVWIDEQEYAVAKLNLWLTDRVNVIGGLVGAVWKFTYDFDREWLEAGLWYTRNSNWHLEGREVFVHRTVDYHEKRWDVQKWEPVPPAEAISSSR